MIFSKVTYYQEKFSRISLAKSAIKEKDFEECEFSDCSFIDFKFGKCKFINCKFKNCLLSATDPTGSRFVEINFLGSKVIGFDWTKAPPKTWKKMYTVFEK